MNHAALAGTAGAATREIVVEELFPHAPAAVWRALTDGALVARWLPMEPSGFVAEVGARFTFRTTPAGAWGGTIRCEVLEVVPNALFAFSWRGGDEANVGYGAPLDTVVTFTLAPEGEGTRLRLVHSGFVAPRNQSALDGMGRGWPKVVQALAATAAEAA